MWLYVASPIIYTPSFQFFSLFSLLVSVRAKSMMSIHNSWTWIRKTQELRLDNQLQTPKRQLGERPIERWTLWAHRWICPNNCSNEGCVDMYTIDYTVRKNTLFFYFLFVEKSTQKHELSTIIIVVWLYHYSPFQNVSPYHKDSDNDHIRASSPQNMKSMKCSCLRFRLWVIPPQLSVLGSGDYSRGSTKTLQINLLLHILIFKYILKANTHFNDS